MKQFETAFAFVLYSSIFFPLQAQDWKIIDADELFLIARQEVFEGHRSKGREKLKYILEVNPCYDEVKIFLARTYAWDGLYEQARKELQTALTNNTANQDAMDALIDVELSTGNHDDALHVAKKGLTTHPNNENFLYKHAIALNSLGRDEEALLSLNKLLEVNPVHKRGIALYNKINFHNLKYTTGVTYGTDFFNRVFDPGRYISAQVSRLNSWGSATLQFNYAHRFEVRGSQWEIELYPKITKRIYAYLNYGYSESILFPEHRIGTEFFFKLPARLESSIGVRFMDFDQDTRILMHTASVGWYFKNYWLSIRPFVTRNGHAGASASATMSLRRYFSSAENYVGVNAGFGFSPDMRRMQNSTGLSENDIYLLRSQRAGISWQKIIEKTWTINLSIDVARQELAFDKSQYVIITSSFLSLRKKI